MSKKHKQPLKQLPFYLILCLNLALVILHWQCARSRDNGDEEKDGISILSHWFGEKDANFSEFKIKDI